MKARQLRLSGENVVTNVLVPTGDYVYKAETTLNILYQTFAVNHVTENVFTITQIGFRSRYIKPNG